MQAVGETFAAELQHRGPDGYGIALFSGETDSAMLMHRRLSILGLGEAGKQPMGSKDGRFYIAFNGEIYNYL
jgi:asparagine synthase (glutamine-hydrolysing)